MRKHYIELSIYNIVNREYPRVVIMDTDENDMGGGTRLYGNKFSVSSSVKTFRIPLTIKLIDDFIDELNVTKNKILEEENGGLKDKLAKAQCGSCDRKGGCDEPEKT